ncbi:Surfeit locus protein 6 [Striga hermonthica]|uniref:Surfeit locus protein 6 n=1 Tax=Striga hermonthica TaxID=68872 RepID=A0A9N7RQR9_STRHE|nr:Surfeit locus protein 6 [Striga hermonthica]
MKKKQKRSPPATSAAETTPTTTTAYCDLKSSIHFHSEFFDRLVELIPARFYLPTDDQDSKPWYQGLSKAAKASLKQQSKQNLRLARRHRFDPGVEPSSTLHLLQQQQNSKSSDGRGNLADLEDDDEPRTDEDKAKSVTYEELRAKLRRKIEQLRGNRGEGSTHERKIKNEGRKRNRDDENEGVDCDKGAPLNEDDDGEETIEYGKVSLGYEDGEGKHVKKKKKKLPKAKELELAKKKQEVKRENPIVAERESWKAAASRARGVKVHDDARMIKESMKREKRKREKNAEKWKERVETQVKMKDEKQRKRKENIQGRINEKKMRRIAKREKKLMRPGFEGRKEGYITKE